MADLPEDIWRLVFQQLRPSDRAWNAPQDVDNVEDLANISLTSKAFREFARPALYHTFDFKESCPSSCLKKLLITLCLHPTYCKLVRVLRIGERDPDIEDLDCSTDQDEVSEEDESAPHFQPDSRGVIAPSVELRKFCMRTINQLCLPQVILRGLEDGISRGLEAAELALLLCMCTRIRKLSLHSDYQPSDSLIAAIILASVAPHDSSISVPSSDPTTSLSFGRLQEVDICHYEADERTSISDLSQILKLPALTTMQLKGIICTSYANIFGIKSTVQSISLYDVQLNAHGLEQLFTACPTVKKLSVEEWFSYDHHINVDYPDFGQGLRQYGTHLEYLKLRLKHMRSARRGLPLGRMSTLTSLKYLQLPFDALFGDSEAANFESDGTDWDQIQHEDYLINILPQSLKTLQIFGQHYEEESDMQDTRLCKLMLDSSFSALATIRMNRTTPVQFIGEELRAQGWQMILNNKIGQLFKRTWNRDT